MTARVEPLRRRTSQDKQIVAILVLLTVAIVGYLEGHGHASPPPMESTREASNAVTVVNYDAASGWRPASSTGVATIPGLSISQPLVLAPDGNAAHAGLIVGRLLDSEFGPVPPQLLAGVRQLPDSEVVDLLNTQAYRYSRLTLTGSGMGLTLYTIPSSASSTTAIVCYASAGSLRYLPACEQLAGTLTIATGSPQVEVRSYESLTPKLTFGQQVSAVVSRVDGLLGSLRPQIRQGTSRAAAATVATRLADGLAGASGSLAGVQPPPAAARAQGSLSESLGRMREGYLALAAAVSGGDSSEYTAAQTSIYNAEASFSTALRNFALLAYK